MDKWSTCSAEDIKAYLLAYREKYGKHCLEEGANEVHIDPEYCVNKENDEDCYERAKMGGCSDSSVKADCQLSCGVCNGVDAELACINSAGNTYCATVVMRGMCGKRIIGERCKLSCGGICD